MERNNEFNLQEKINDWTNHIKSKPSLTDADSEELKSHLLDLIYELKDAGLDEEEAFWVSLKRMGSSLEWEADYSDVNKPLIQMRRSLFILAGVLAFFLLYYFIEFSSKLLFIILLNKTDGFISIIWVSRYLIAVHIIFILFVVRIYSVEKETLSFIEKITLKPKQTLVLVLTTIIFSISDTCLFTYAKSLINQDYPLRSKLIHVYLYFDYTFPLVVCLSFVFLFFKYYKKTRF